MAASAENLIAEARRHHLAGRLQEAEGLYIDALRLQPKHPDGLHYLGVLRMQLGDPEGAAKLIARAIKARPGVVDMHMNLGAAHRRLGESSQAVFAFRKALALQPQLAVARLQLANALRESQDPDGAVSAYRAYLAEKPEDPAAYLGLGQTHAAAGRFEAAMTAFDDAIVRYPEFAEAYSNIGTVLEERGHHQASLPFHERAVELAPGVAEWRIELALNFLLLERFAEGWPHYEARCERKTKTIVRHAAPPPYWSGEDLAGKRLRIWMEQGVGDQILLSSMLPDVIARAAHCTVECTPRLAPIFARSFPAATVVANPDLTFPVTASKAFDYQIGAGSLGRYTRESLTDFPRYSGYLRADDAKAAAIRARYTELAQGRTIVGLSWRTIRGKEGLSPDKSADILGFAPILKTEGCMFVNLQYGDCRADLARVKKQLGIEVYQDPDVDTFADIDGLFAQIAATDLVITTSNTTAHIAGAQNKPVWILLPLGSGLPWYWFLKRSDSPWYPSARLLRAQSRESAWWTHPLASAATMLRDVREKGGA